jgi:hypothetical protein
MKEFLKDKLLSRKFLTVVVAAAGAAVGLISWSDVVQLASIWLGAQGLVDATSKFKQGEK